MKNQIKKSRYMKFISRLFAKLPFIIIISLFFYITFLFINYITLNLFKRIGNDMLSIIISSVSDLIIVYGILAIPEFNKLLKNLYVKIENKIYLLINDIIKNNWIRSKFIFSYNAYYMSAFDSQSNVINQFIKNIYDDDKKLFFIIGDRSSGKTSMLIMLIAKCANNTEYYKAINNHIIYLCKITSYEQIIKFIEKYTKGKYKDNYIFIDDIGEMPEISQMRLWEEIVKPLIQSENYLCKGIMVLTNDSNSLFKNRAKNCLDSDLFITIIKDKKKTKSVSKKVKSFCEQYCIYDLEFQRWLESLKLTNVNTYENIIEIFLGNKNISMKILFICIIINVKYSKIANIYDIFNLYKELGYNFLKFKKNLNQLINLEAIIIFPFYKNYVYIRQSVLNFLLKTYRKDEIYKDIICNFEKNYNIENDVDKWLINYETQLFSKKYIFNRVLFSKAFNCGNFEYLLTNLNELIEVRKDSEKYFYKELGYLNERVGNRVQAIEYLRKHIKNSDNNIIERTQSYLLLFEIEHHFNQDITYIQKISMSDNIFLRLQGQYWIEHINIEKGSFNYSRLLSIVKQYSNITYGFNSLNYYHILRRMYSDLARVYFLNGEINKKRFAEFKRMMEYSKLFDHNIEFEDYFELLTVAQYLHYDVLFQIGFYKYYKYDCDDKYGSNPKLDEILSEAINQYYKCENNFRKYGDKAWMTVSIRKNELLLCTEAQPIRIINELNNLRDKFISNNNDLHLAFIDIILCKAEFIRYYFNELDLDPTEVISKCIFYLNESEKISNGFKNEYGVYRVNFIRLFLSFFEDIQIDNREAVNLFREQLAQLDNQKYHRESEMIHHILRMREIPINIICDFFKFYPIVLQ